jgi:hypothetical protein
VLSTHLQEWITAGDIEIMRWTTGYGSVGSAVTQLAKVRIIGLPCNLNSIPVIEYVLSPVALMLLTQTTANMISATCTAWCTTSETLPDIIRIKVLPRHLADITQLSAKDKCKCPLLILKICKNAILDGVPFT